MLNLMDRPNAHSGIDSAGGECPACGGSALSDFHRVTRAPTNSCILLKTREEALAYPTGDIVLAHCADCGFVFNRAFDLRKTEYSGRYEETQSFSPTFNRFHRVLAERLVAKYDLKEGTALEIGCGKGEFLALLAEIGAMKGVGVDPGVHVERIAPEVANKLSFIPAMFAPDHIDRDFDLVACKMTIEHIPDPLDFVATIRKGIGARKDCVVFFQAPESMRILSRHAFEDVYYEHCSYFTPGSLARLFRRAHFDVIDIQLEYDDQYLAIEARPAPEETTPSLALEDDLDRIAAEVDSFARGCAKAIGAWRERLDEAAAKGEKVALWGSGSKAVSFLNAVDSGARVQYVTDINPHRHGHFLPATGQEIVPPAALREIRPDLVIVMNRIYKDEIRRDLDAMGLAPEVAAL
ncbi:MAG: class I SAM-dependent methyltransferase [Amphiplicatus sp.]